MANAVLPAPPGPLATIVEPVRCFDQDSVAAIIATLEASPPGWPPGWALETLGTLRTVSPSAVMWTFEAVCRGALLTLEQCLAAELALTRHVTRHPDFAEGVRAMVVDKDRNPRWSPPRLEDVSADDIAAMFER